MKTCTKCGLKKSELEFVIDHNYCKDCDNIRDKQYREKNKERIKEQQKLYYEKNKERLKLRQRLYYQENKKGICIKVKEYEQKNKDLLNNYRKQYRSENREKIKALNKSYREKHREALKESGKKYYEENKVDLIEKSKEYQLKNRVQTNKNKREYQQNRRKIDLNFKLKLLLRTRLLTALKNSQKAGSAVQDLGCSIEELKTYLESKFKPGMSWENHGLRGWHVDHIVPLSSFDLTNREELLKACHYTNLQPLWATDNLKKSNKIPN